MDPEQQNPYSFITDKPAATKASFLNTGDEKRRIIIVAVGALILIIIAIIVFGLVSGSGKKDVDLVYQAAAAQQDLIALTDLGITTVRNGQLLNQSSTANIVITSQSKDTAAYLAKIGVGKSSAKAIGLLRDSSFKKVLDTAKNNGNYDDSYTAIYANRVDLYRSKLNAAYGKTNSKSLKTMFSNFYTQLNALDNKPDSN